MRAWSRCTPTLLRDAPGLLLHRLHSEVQGLEFGVLGFRVWGLEFGV